MVLLMTVAMVIAQAMKTTITAQKIVILQVSVMRAMYLTAQMMIAVQRDGLVMALKIAKIKLMVVI